MKYLVLERGFGEGCDYTIGCAQRWRIVEFDGEIGAATNFFMRQALYGDDEDGKPEDYSRITGTDGQVQTLIVLPFDDAVCVDMGAARAKHNAYWDECDAVALLDREKVELARLKAKLE